MKHHSSIFGWLTLVILCTILSCTDHRDLPPAVRFRVKTIRSSQTNFTHVLTYDNLGRLASYTGPSSESFSKGVTSYNYDNYGQPGKEYDFSTTKFITKPEAIFITYKFDGQRRLSQVVYYDGNAGGVSLGKLLAYDYVYTDNSSFPSSRIATRFVNNGSTIVGSKTELYSFAGGNATTVDSRPFTYDASPNPYKGLLGFNDWYYANPDFGYDSNIGSLNRPFSVNEPFSDSLVKVFNQNNRTTDAQLTYNSDGLVTKITYKNGSTEEFTYETY